MLAAALVAALLVVAATGVHAATRPSASNVVGYPPLTVCVKRVKHEVKVRGRLTVATSYPALSPWFVKNTPWNQEGYESAVAYHIATTLGFKTASVHWYSEPYEFSENAGAKKFDFDINEFVYQASLTTKVAFSTSYYNVDQSLVALKTDAVVAHHTPADLKTYLYGGVTGSPGLAFVSKQVKPTRAPVAYKTMALAIAALQSGTIDAIVVDVPTGQYLATQQLSNGDQVGQFKTTGEHYVVLLQHASPLTACVDTAIRTLAQRGTLTQLSKRWLTVYNSIPVLQP